MKIINAPWEKRNLGVTTQEITLENNDTLDDFKQKLNSVDSEYAVLKIPANKINFVWFAEDNDFRFVENQFTMLGNIKKILPEAENLLKRNKKFIVETNNSSEMFAFIASKIKEGIFHTDRIAVDPFFNNEIANLRYANWLLDLKDNLNTHMQVMRKDGKIVAFNLNKHDGQLSHGLIGGIFKEFQNEPIGLYWGAAIFKNISDVQGINIWEATVSSNNYSIIKIWEYFGMQVSNITSVFVRHRGLL